MAPPLLHLTTPTEWRAALATGAIAPPSLKDGGFVHLSTPEQVALPATRMFAGRHDLLLLVLDPDRLAGEVRYEPGVAGDPESMRFPHAYDPVPTSAVLAVVPYRPGAGGTFDPPVLPTADPAGRLATLDPSLLRRAATTEVPVTGGVAVLTAPVALSDRHNQLLIDGETDAATMVVDADRALGGTGRSHRLARLTGAHLAATAAGLADRGWEVKALVGMAGPAGGTTPDRVEQLDVEALRPFWDALFRRDMPGIGDAEVVELTDRFLLEEQVIDLRYLAVREADTVVACCLLKIDGGTALLDLVNTDPGRRGRGHGDALVSASRAAAGAAGCDLVVLDAVASDWPRHWYARRGFTEVTRSWSACRPSTTTPST